MPDNDSCTFPHLFCTTNVHLWGVSQPKRMPAQHLWGMAIRAGCHGYIRIFEDNLKSLLMEWERVASITDHMQWTPPSHDVGLTSCWCHNFALNAFWDKQQCFKCGKWRCVTPPSGIEPKHFLEVMILQEENDDVPIFVPLHISICVMVCSPAKVICWHVTCASAGILSMKNTT